MGYPELMEKALKGVVRAALDRVADGGLPGAHHLYITFRTDAPGVEIAPRLRAQYPDEMAIVLQHQFWGLETDDDGFRVTLTFGGISEPLKIPWDALIGFADPSVEFGLRFGIDEDAAAADDGGAPDEGPPDEGETEADDGDEDEKSGEVVTLDSFRKK